MWSGLALWCRPTHGKSERVRIRKHQYLALIPVAAVLQLWAVLSDAPMRTEPIHSFSSYTKRDILVALSLFCSWQSFERYRISEETELEVLGYDDLSPSYFFWWKETLVMVVAAIQPIVFLSIAALQLVTHFDATPWYETVQPPVAAVTQFVLWVRNRTPHEEQSWVLEGLEPGFLLQQLGFVVAVLMTLIFLLWHFVTDKYIRMNSWNLCILTSFQLVMTNCAVFSIGLFVIIDPLGYSFEDAAWTSAGATLFFAVTGVLRHHGMKKLAWTTRLEAGGMHHGLAI